MLHGFAVADFAHQNHVWRLAQCVFQRGFPTVGIQSDFALGHYAVFVCVYKFHRVFNRDDVAVGVVVAPVHQGRQRGGFARTGGTHHDAQSAFGHGNFFEHLGHTQSVNGGQNGRDHPQDHADLALLDKRIDAKATHAGWGDGEIALFGAFKIRHLLVVHDGTRQRQRVYSTQCLWRDFGHLAIDLDGGWKVAGDE